MQQVNRLRKWRRRLLIVAVLGLFAVAAIYIFRGIPGDAGNAMRDADSFELLSLDPEEGRSDADFHRFKVLGRAMVTDAATRVRLYTSLQSSARWSVPIPVMCFDPRHGIRVTSRGRTFDLLICFECRRAQVWEAETLLPGFSVGGSPQPVFDQALRDAGLPLASK